MPFRVSLASREWFRHIWKEFDVDFDVFYLGAMAGLLGGRKSPIKASEAPEVLEYFPELHRTHQHLVIGMLLAAELRGAGLQLKDRKLVHSVVGGLVNPKDPAHLSEAGFAAINEYAEGGVQAMKEWFGDPPRIKSVFILRYLEKMQSLSPAPLQV